jgi:formylglycine-generating enzyme required for sulfatase activity
MSGNVWEWTRSLWGDYPYPAVGDSLKARESLVAAQVDLRVRRGGSFDDDARGARTVFRLMPYPNYRLRKGGLRIVVIPATLGSGGRNT